MNVEIMKTINRLRRKKEEIMHGLLTIGKAYGIALRPEENEITNAICIIREIDKRLSEKERVVHSLRAEVKVLRAENKDKGRGDEGNTSTCPTPF